MFDKNKFAVILKNINETYNSQRDFAKKSEINRTYLSQYMNMKLEEPPKPKTLQKLANASNGITSYGELMDVCGYTNSDYLYKIFLEDEYKKVESDYLNSLSKFVLNADEKEVYDDMFHIIPEDVFNDMPLNKIKEIVLSYFNNITFLSPESKEKVFKKTLLFIEYCNETSKMKDRLEIFNNKSKKKDIPNDNLLTQFYMCPVYGRISAGQPNWAEENIEGRIPVPMTGEIDNPEECFYLKVNGESMNKVVKNGAYALIHKQDIVEDGEIAVVLVNGYDATLKKFSKQGDFVVLEPMSDVTDDPDIKTQIYDKSTSIKILGKYIGKFELNG